MKYFNQKSSLGITLVSLLMILFGSAEMVTGFTHNFFGVTTTQSTAATYIGAALGACYFLSGLLTLTMKKWAATVAIILLVIDVVGRITMVSTGLFPIDSTKQTFSIVAGTAIAVIFAIYIGIRWKAFK